MGCDLLAGIEGRVKVIDTFGKNFFNPFFIPLALMRQLAPPLEKCNIIQLLALLDILLGQRTPDILGYRHKQFT